MRVATVCTGIGSPEKALENLGIPHEIVFGCEIDKYARQTYLANFNPGFMEPDMTKCDWEGEKYYADLFIGGIPCQAFSLAGKRLGELDPRGLLFYDFYRYVKVQQPKYFIIENVKGLLSMNDGEVFQNWINLLGLSVNGDQFMFPHEDSLMYNLHWQVLNTKDYGLPQNRERVFLIGIRNDLPNTFVFPKKIPLELRLKDILEDEVDEKYYLSDETIAKVINSNFNQERSRIQTEDVCDTLLSRDYKDPKCVHVKSAIIDDINNREGLILYGNSQDQKLSPLNGCSQTLSAGHFNQPKILIPSATKLVGVMIGAMRGRNPENTSDITTGAPTQQMLEINENGTSNCLTSVQKDNLVVEQQIIGYTRDGNGKVVKRHLKDEAGTLTSASGGGGNTDQFVLQSDCRIRKLTTKECFRLQGLPDEFHDKAVAAGVSNSQLYKQAGNSITVNVIQAILKNLLK